MIKLVAAAALTACLSISFAAAQTEPAAPPVATPVTLSQPAGTPAPSAADAAAPINPDNAVICRNEREAGTMFTRRLCHTMRRWKQMEADAYNTLDRLDSGKDTGLFQ
jgi:hypothetical protein